MNAALAHQQQGEWADADRLYGVALALDPDNFDALHMQGVVAYQRREFHRAESLIRRAIAINPQIEAAHHNLNLVLSSHALGSELCRAMLPALAIACDPGAPAAGAEIQLICFEANGNAAVEEYRLALLEALTAAPRVRAWQQQRDGTLLVLGGGQSEELPRSGTFVFIGAHAAPGGWYRNAAPADAVIVCLEAAPCAVYDQIRAVSGELARRVHLWHASDDVAAEIGLAGGHGDARALAAWLQSGPQRSGA